MIRASQLRPIKRSCTRRYRTPLEHTKCLIGHVWISEEGLQRAFDRFFAVARSPTTIFDNTGCSCKIEALVCNRASRGGAQSCRAVNQSSSTSSVKLRNSGKCPRDGILSQNALSNSKVILYHQYFRPRIKQSGGINIIQIRTVATLPKERRNEAQDREIQHTDGGDDDDGWDPSRVLRSSQQFRHDVRYITKTTPYSTPSPLNSVRTSRQSASTPTSYPSLVVDSQHLSRPSLPTNHGRFMAITGTGTGSEDDAVVGDWVSLINAELRSAMEDDIAPNIEIIQEEGSQQRKGVTEEQDEKKGISKALVTVTGTRIRALVPYNPPSKVYYQPMTPLISEEEVVSHEPVQPKFRSIALSNERRLERFKQYIAAAHSAHPQLFASTALEAKALAERKIAKLLRLHRARNQHVKLVYKLSRANYVEVLESFIDLFYDRVFTDESLEDDDGSGKLSTTDDWTTPVVLGYWMLRLMLPQEFSQFHRWNLKNLLVKLITDQEWLIALWLLYEGAHGWTGDDFKFVMSSRTMNKMRGYSKLPPEIPSTLEGVFLLMAGHECKDFVLSRQLEKPSITVTRAETLRNDFETFQNRAASCVDAEGFFALWTDLKEHKSKTKSPFAILAIASVVDRIVGLRFDNTDLWSPQSEANLLSICADMFLALDDREQAMLFKHLVSFLRAWIDLGAQQAEILFTAEDSCESDGHIRTIPYLSAFLLFLDPSVRYAAIRAIFHIILEQDIEYSTRDKRLALVDMLTESYDFEAIRNIEPTKRTQLQNHLFNIFENRMHTFSQGDKLELGQPEVRSSLRRPWSLETLWPLLEVAKHEPEASMEWRTYELGEILVEFRGRFAVSWYLKDSSDSEVLMFLVRSWLRHKDRGAELSKRLRRSKKEMPPEIPTSSKAFKDYISKKIISSIKHSNSTEGEQSDIREPAGVYARAIFILEEMGCNVTPLISEIFNTLMALQRPHDVVSLTHILQLRSPPTTNRPKISLPTTITLANYLTLHHPPSALFFLARLPGRNVASYRNFVALHAADRHYLARTALLEFLSRFPRDWPEPHGPPPSGYSRLQGVFTLQSRRPAWEWWSYSIAAWDMRRSARDMLAAYARGIAVSEELKPQQSARRAHAAMKTGGRLRLGPDIRIAEAVLFCVVVRRAQQELLKPMRSSLLDAASFVRKIFSKKRVGHLIRVLYVTAQEETAGKEAEYTIERRMFNVRYGSGGKGGRYVIPWVRKPKQRLLTFEQWRGRDKVARAELFVEWLKEVVFVMKCNGGKLAREHIKAMYSLDGDPDWKPGGVRMDDY